MLVWRPHGRCVSVSASSCGSHTGTRVQATGACERPHVWGPYGQGGRALWPLLPHWTAQASSFAVSPASPCAWNVCVTRKAPLLASDSSSSGGSDSEDYQKAASAVDAVSRSPGREAPPRPTGARTEEAVGRCVGRGERGGPAQVQRVRLPGRLQVSAPPRAGRGQARGLPHTASPMALWPSEAGSGWWCL